MVRNAALIAVVALLTLPAAAHADGDPASDFLISERVFLPYDTKIPVAKQELLTGLVADAAAKGYPVRVAVIGSSYDLGSVTVVWKQPQRYARFLGVELSFVHKTPLLVVMPNGLGFYWKGHDTSKERALLAKIPIQSGGSGLAQAASTAVRQLAGARGLQLKAVKIATPAGPSHRNRDDRLVIVAAVAVALVVGAVARLLMLRRRRSA